MSFSAFHAGAFFTNARAHLIVAAPYLSLSALLVAVIALVLLLALRRRLARLALGRNGSFEETLAILAREMKELKDFRAEVEKYLKFAEARLRGSVSGVGVVRFNPFAGSGQGGNQSFAVAFLDEHGSGVVFSTLYTRDRVGSYAKPVENGASPFELTHEEKEALEKAKQSIASRKKKT